MARHVTVTHLIEPALPYEFGSLADLLPIYVRGTAYLAVNAPAQAEVEFQKIIRNRNIDPLTALYILFQCWAWLAVIG